MPWKDDLSATKGEDQVLFTASEGSWVRPTTGIGYITDGCFVHKTKSGKLLMIWSSNSASGYAVGTVISESGKIKGSWKHQEQRLFEKDGGHGMIFKTFEGDLVISLHQPNGRPNERMKLYKLKEVDDHLVLDGQLFTASETI